MDYRDGIIKGLELAYQVIDRADPNNENKDIIAIKLAIIQLIKKWIEFNKVNSMSVGELNELSIADFNKLDNVDKALLVLNKLLLQEKVADSIESNKKDKINVIND